MNRSITCAHITAVGVIALAIWPCVLVRRQERRQSLNRALIAAIKRSDSGGVEAQLAAGANPNTQDLPVRHETFLQQIQNLFHPPPKDRSKTALLVTLNQYRDDSTLPPQMPLIVKALVTKGANVNVVDEQGDTPLNILFASFSTVEYTQAVQTLLDAGANTEARGPAQVTPLWEAACHGFIDSVRMLLEHGAKAETWDPEGVTPLIAAAANRRTDIVNILIDHGAPIEAKDLAGDTALKSACEYHCTNVVRTLLAHGAKTNPVAGEYATPLRIAESKGYADIVTMLKAHGAKD